MKDRFLKGIKILIVDDLEINRRIVRVKLEKLGAEIREASGGYDAVSLVLSEYFDFVIMDIFMPDLDGLSASRQIRQAGNNLTPVFAFTSDRSSEFYDETIDAGMDGCIYKPFRVSDLDRVLDKKEIDRSSGKRLPTMHWLKLMYITNRPEVALIAEKYGVDRIWIDLETLGKEQRQHGDTVKSHHSVEDIRTIKPLLTRSEMLVRIDPWNENSMFQIDSVIDAGADIIMLPMWKDPETVKRFTDYVSGRTKTVLLLETREAVDCIDVVLSQGGFDEIHIGLNDLHLSYGMPFMFELLSRGDVETLCDKFRAAGIPYGFGGIARLGKGELKSEKVIMEHRRLGSTRAILSRSFCDAYSCRDVSEIEALFRDSMEELFAYEAYCRTCSMKKLLENKNDVIESVRAIEDSMKKA